MDNIYKTIYIDVDEEITEVVDRLRSADAGEIFLVVPQKAAILQSIINLKILKEEAEKLDKKVFIVTRDKIGRNLASRAGFITRKSIDAERGGIEPVLKETMPYFYQEDSLDENTGQEQKDQITVSDIIKSVKDARYKEEKEGMPIEINIVKKSLGAVEQRNTSPLTKFSSKSFRRKSIIPSFDRKVFLIFSAATAIIVSIIVFIVLPKAEIKIFPVTEPLSLSIEVTASSSVKDINLNIYEIPAKVLSWEKEIKESFTATGEEEKGEKARGEATIYNNTDSAITIIAGTRLEASSKMIFRTQKKIAVPARSGNSSGTAKAEVVADEGGEKGNIKPEKLVMVALPAEVQNQIYAKNEQSFSGGTSNKITKITEDDVKNAKEYLTKKTGEEMRETLKEEVKKLISEGGYVFLDQAFGQEIEEMNLDKEVGAEASTFEARAKVLTKAIVYKQRDFSNLIMAEVDAVIGKDKRIFESHKDINTEFKEFNFKEEKMKLTIFLEAPAIMRIDEAGLKNSLAGKKKDEAANFLKEQKGIRNASIILWPFWVKKVPAVNKKIKIEYEI